jgi:hypothetical protein
VLDPIELPGSHCRTSPGRMRLRTFLAKFRHWTAIFPTKV